MEVAEELIATNPDSKKAEDLKAENKRRAEAIPSMIRNMKEAQAQEELDAHSPKIIGGSKHE